MFKNKLINSFLDELSSSSSTPGGGTVSALLSSLSTALCSMMASLTIDKKGYENYRTSSMELINRMDKRRDYFFELMDKDAKSFDSVIEAFKLPKDTTKEKSLRKQAIKEGYINAIKIPIEIAEKTMELFDDIEYIVINGNKNLITDGIAAAMTANCAINMALLNVKINLKSIDDKKYVKDTMSDVIDLEVAAAGHLARICSRSGLQF